LDSYVILTLILSLFAPICMMKQFIIKPALVDK